MALIDIAARDIPEAGTPVLTLEDLPGATGEGLAVFLPAGTAPEAVLPYLSRLALLLVEFPKFRDGRGFTLGRTLRERYGFQGDIRATGHIIPDQLSMLKQCGFTSVMTPQEHPPEQWRGLREPTQRQLLQRLLVR